MVKPSQEDELFLHGYEMLFFEILAPFHIPNTSEGIRPCFRKKFDMSQQP